MINIIPRIEKIADVCTHHIRSSHHHRWKPLVVAQALRYEWLLAILTCRARMRCGWIDISYACWRITANASQLSKLSEYRQVCWGKPRRALRLASTHMAPNRLGSLSASSFFTRSLPGGSCEGTQPAREGGHRMKGTRPSISAKGTCSQAAPFFTLTACSLSSWPVLAEQASVNLRQTNALLAE